MTRPIFGGWTPTYEGDLCQGGHPQSITDHECGRCGRKVDPFPCLCGDPDHRGQLSRSMCPTRMRFDKRDAEVHLGVTTLDAGPGTDAASVDWARAFARNYWLHGSSPETQAALTILSRLPTPATIERWSRHLLHTSQHNSMIMGLGGRLQRQANEMRKAIFLERFGWGDAIVDAEFEECSVHVDNCKGQETH